MNSVSNASAAARTSMSNAPIRDQMNVRVEKMEQDQVKADGRTAERLMESAAEVQRATGKGRHVDVRG